MVSTVVSAVIVGVIVGALTRRVMPEKHNPGIVMTSVLGAAGAFLGSWLTYGLGYTDANRGWAMIPFVVGVIVAVVVIAIYLAVTGRDRVRR
ncbi:MAG TPA: GlsB/YeaQ/YmgE family stress response membrane protein [Mycobacterium sp.]|uniref:GlsB/YeaQ/YmgE family stress response membrane protein n=1 Tax=Mycobacterium sp. TaxID=1785 RepID=UPI002D66C3C6|nr:GlsB/YeaQ/YmgE family stress response membrane protein [Mycobacterium sp.]HZU48463.1 GlsB/YeaQ/YmgE family stress response membrane protein [Mycobacterium sp.]